jgi:hypothetical protein
VPPVGPALVASAERTTGADQWCRASSTAAAPLVHAVAALVPETKVQLHGQR